jgi:hypothetical protein
MIERLPNIKADEGTVRAVMEHLIDSFEAFADQRDGLGYIDVFMGVHNFHKLMVFDIIRRVTDAHPDEPPEQMAALLLNMAHATWEDALAVEAQKRGLTEPRC